MKEIKVEKDVVLNDCHYYLKMILNGIYNMLGGFDNLRSRETYNRAKELNDAKFLLVRYTTELEKYIIDFKNDRKHNIDIDSVINDYNCACNNIIRELINKNFKEEMEFLNDLMCSAEMVMNSTGHNRKCMKNEWLRMEFERAYALHCILDFLYEYIHEADDELIKEINNARLTWNSEYIDGVEDMYVAIWRIADECEHRENNLLWSMISFLGKANTLKEINRKYHACKCILGEM